MQGGLSTTSARTSDGVVAELFPMHTVPARVFMDLAAMESFGQLRSRGVLKVTGCDAVVHFISHQWLGFRHPDPDGEQLRRMQEVFRVAAEGRVSDLFEPHVWKAYAAGVSTGSLGKYRALEASASARGGVLTEQLFGQHVASGEVWVDYGSVPQAGDIADAAEAEMLQQLAVRSIPAYLERCDYFWVLTPTAKHADKGTWCNFTTWRSRGWCRLEEWGNFLSTNSCAPLIITHAPKLRTIGMLDLTMACQGKPAMAPCAGAFRCCQLNHRMLLPSGSEHAVPCDKEFVLPVLVQLWERKQRQLRARLDSKFHHGYLCSVVGPMIFGGARDPPAWCPADLEKETVEEFLYRFALHSVQEVVPPNVTVWHWAATIGHVPMLRKLAALPEAAAILHDSGPSAEIAGCCAMQGHIGALEALMEMGLVSLGDLDVPFGATAATPIDRAAKYGFPDMVRFLLGRGASVACCRSDGATPLHGAAETGHASCCRVLLEHRADANATDKSGRAPIHLAADPVTFNGLGEGKLDVLQVLLQHRADPQLLDGMGRTALGVARAALFKEGEELLRQFLLASGETDLSLGEAN